MQQAWVESAYYFTGTVSVFMGAFVTYMLFTKNAQFIRSRVFLKYSLFRSGFFILMAGLLVFAVTNIMAMFKIEEFHGIGEIVYNVSMILFIAVMCAILSPQRQK